jgi:hypothetical protein
VRANGTRESNQIPTSRVKLSSRAPRVSEKYVSVIIHAMEITLASIARVI